MSTNDEKNRLGALRDLTRSYKGETRCLKFPSTTGGRQDTRAIQFPERIYEEKMRRRVRSVKFIHACETSDDRGISSST